MHQVSQVSIGRFHHFHLARQLEKYQILSKIYTGYPKFKLKDEDGIDPDKIISFPWLHTPYMLALKMGLSHWPWLNREWIWQARESLDRYVASQIDSPTTLIALYSLGLHCGAKAQSLGGLYICTRGSTHIQFQSQLLKSEYNRLGIKWMGFDPRLVKKEKLEYLQADYIVVPSQFAYDSFLDQKVDKQKLVKIPFGSRIERFRPQNVQKNSKEFLLLFVGSFQIRKGIFDLLQAFQKFKHPHKRLIVVGDVLPEARKILATQNLEKIEFIGTISNEKLAYYYSLADVFIFPSIEDGFGVVIGEAMACGCPVIATTNTGASELITDGIEGFIVPIRSPDIICDRLTQLSADPVLQKSMSEAAIKRVKEIGGWNTFGESWYNFLCSLSKK